VLQYGLLEAQATPGGRAWYDAYVAAHPILAFFKDKRDISIHRAQVRPAAHVAVTVTDTVVLSDSLTIEVRDPKGNLVERRGDVASPSAASPPRERLGSASTVYSYRFADWPGGNDVVALSTQYLAELRGFIADGQARGYLTP
jgi:hypothetical protein